jgi:hypothetical protein
MIRTQNCKQCSGRVSGEELVTVPHGAPTSAGSSCSPAILSMTSPGATGVVDCAPHKEDAALTPSCHPGPTCGSIPASPGAQAGDRTSPCSTHTEAQLLLWGRLPQPARAPDTAAIPGESAAAHGRGLESEEQRAGPRGRAHARCLP